ncbi:nuclease-related domain-containing protein [Microcella flavibacter]|uniref:nuclease-related domain-containing protein n=1 Tax=Microcella flavibacter TaxID=1804990 RepID=UPI0014573EDB|nr:nuclease-related domain-containing protein [Microcella flavibacter]
MTSDTSAAGASARREYDRRRAKDEQRTREQWGRLGGLAVALTPERRSTRAWSIGAVGEEKVGQALDALASDSIRVLHDRRIPGSRANIDHIVITPGAVWVIDAKRYAERRPELRVEGGIIRPRTESLIVGGRDQTRLIDGVLGQSARVCAAIPGNPIRSALCFVDADWPLFGGAFSVRGVEVLWRARLADRILATASGAVDVDAVAAAAETRFRPSV